jgi:hypothetical protein
MQRERKLQRLDYAPPPPQPTAGKDATDEADEAAVKRANSVVKLDAVDHQTHSSFADVSCQHTYNVSTGEFNISASDRNGNGYLIVKLDTERVYKKLGIRRVISDAAATVKSIKLLQSDVFLRKRDGSASVDTSTTVEAEEEEVGVAEVAAKLKECVRRELTRLVTYGPSRYVVVRHAKDPKETTAYRIVLFNHGESIDFQFTSIEADRVTGKTSVRARELWEAIAKMLGTNEDDDDFAAAMQTSGSKTFKTDTFTLSVGKQNHGRGADGAIELSVALPDDSFTSGDTCYAHVGNLYLAN